MTFYRAAKTAPTACLREDRRLSGRTPIASLFYGSNDHGIKTAYTESYSHAYTMPAKAEAGRSASPAPVRKMASLQREWGACIGQLKDILNSQKGPVDYTEGAEQHSGRRSASERPPRAGSLEAQSGRAQINLASAVARARRERSGGAEHPAGRPTSRERAHGAARSRAGSQERPAAQVRTVSVDHGASLSGRCHRGTGSADPSRDSSADFEVAPQAPPTPREAPATPRDAHAAPRPPTAGSVAGSVAGSIAGAAGAGSRPPSARPSSRPGSARPQSARPSSARAPSVGRSGMDEMEVGSLTERRSIRVGSAVPRPPLPRPPAAPSAAATAGYPAQPGWAQRRADACATQAAMVGASGRNTPRLSRESVSVHNDGYCN